jgi:hypothetical protein
LKVARSLSGFGEPRPAPSNGESVPPTLVHCGQ